ncbi:MAG: hypothetical protein JSR27_01355 [Proteobacteria bacterium]|nr:hypothetical protein [Pseudomonadota bacterium]
MRAEHRDVMTKPATGAAHAGSVKVSACAQRTFDKLLNFPIRRAAVDAPVVVST